MQDLTTPGDVGSPLLPLAGLDPATIFQPDGLSDLLDRIEAEALSVVPDIASAKGRKAIAGMAAKVARSKVYLDQLGKDLTADLKKRTAVVDAERKAMRDRLDALKVRVRAPLTEWEQAEADRLERHRLAISEIEETAANPEAMDCAALGAAIETVEAVALGDSWEEFEAQAARAKDAALTTLRAALVRRSEYEAEQVELARLRAEQVERERLEREERLTREAAERAKREAEERAREEARRIEQEREAERLQAENARLKAEQARAEAEQRAAEAEQRAALAAEQAAAQERARAKAEADCLQAEEARRKADRDHALAVKTDAARDLVALGLDAEQARTVVVAICEGRVRRVSIAF